MCKNIHNSTMSDPIYRNIPIILTGTDEEIVANVMEKLNHKLLIIRQKGFTQIKTLMASSSSDEKIPSPSPIATMLAERFIEMTENKQWEIRQSGFLGAKEILHLMDDDFAETMIGQAEAHLEDSESRVRTSVADCLEALTKLKGISVYLRLRDQIIASIERNFVRDERQQADDRKKTQELKARQEAAAAATATTGASVDATKAPDAAEKDEKESKQTETETETETAPASAHTHTHTHGHGHGHGHHHHDHDHAHAHAQKKAEKGGSKAPKGMHDTEGWKSLETSFITLQRMMKGAGSAFSPHITEALLDLIYRSIKHTNRFVRENGYFACATISKVASVQQLETIADSLTKVLAYGLADNWSQVRFASSTATRSFLEHSKAFQKKYFGRLLPPMCLNRYYVAQGVRLYSQATWQQAIGAKGTELVAEFVEDIVPFYASQAEADNHAVREAACYCIAELGSKVGHGPVSKHVLTLLRVLISCFKDESWPVRDAACTACGTFVSAFPEECRPKLDELYQLWFDHLADNIPSVREGSAIAMGKVIRVYKDEALARVVPHIKENLCKARDQQSDSKKYGSLTNTTLFGVAAKKSRDNDAALHENQQLFSCGSLAPKLKRGAGCMDHGFRRACERWEYTDGCMYLLRELSAIYPEVVSEYIEQMGQMADLKHFAHYTNLITTVWTVLPIIAQNLGKKPFKRVMQPIIEPVFFALTCDNRLAMNAAGQCISFLRKFIGPTIFEGRLSPKQVQLMHSSPFCDMNASGKIIVAADNSNVPDSDAPKIAFPKFPASASASVSASASASASVSVSVSADADADADADAEKKAKAEKRAARMKMYEDLLKAGPLPSSE